MASRTQPLSYVLIDNGFDEIEVVSLLSYFRRAGLAIKTVSLFQPMVYSQQGIVLKADLCLADQAMEQTEDTLIILPAGGRNAESLRRDSRVKQLLTSLAGIHGKIAVTNGQCQLAKDVKLQVKASTYQPEPNQTLPDFVHTLANCLSPVFA